MKKLTERILLFLIIAIIIALLISTCHNQKTGQGQGTPNSKPEIITVFQTTVKHDTTTTTKWIKVPMPGHTDTAYKYVVYPAVIDTAFILKDYFARFIYIDTVNNDTSALIIISDTVTQNRIKARRLTYRNNRPTVINKTTTTVINKTQPVRHYYTGVFLGGSINSLDCGPGAIYEDKQGRLYNASWGLIGHRFNIGVNFKIR